MRVDAGAPAGPGSFAALYRGEMAFVYNVLRRFAVPEAELEDLTHDVFLAAYRAQGAFEPSRPLRPWLVGIAFRVASDSMRLARREREVHADDHVGRFPDPGRSPQEAAEARQAQQLVQRALGALEMDRRAVFVLHDIEDLSMPQVARALEIPEGTAWSRLRQARSEFAQAVRALHQGGAS